MLHLPPAQRGQATLLARVTDARGRIQPEQHDANNGHYLIKGVAGGIFWKLASDYTRLGRTEFSNRELRLDPAIPLPDVTDNLEARLLLLQRRLAEHGPHLRIEKTGRGRFRLQVLRPLALQEVAS